MSHTVAQSSFQTVAKRAIGRCERHGREAADAGRHVVIRPRRRQKPDELNDAFGFVEPIDQSPATQVRRDGHVGSQTNRKSSKRWTTDRMINQLITRGSYGTEAARLWSAAYRDE